MDINPDMPAMPMDHKNAVRAEEGYYDPYAYGLTKREHFAGIILAGLSAGPDESYRSWSEAVDDAIKAADLLLEKLESTANDKRIKPDG